MQQQQYTTPSWNEVLSNWGNMFVPQQRCETCGQVRKPARTDWASQASDVLSTPMLQAWGQLWGSLLDPWMQAARTTWGPMVQPFPPAHDRDCGCSRCMPDDCHCRCCVSDADLLVYARIGERRMVPLVLENNTRRERAVELGLSDWATYGGQRVQVTGQLSPTDGFTLQPCESRTVMLALEVADSQSQISDQPETMNDTRSNRMPDLDKCVVFYADLRVKGCDIRPIRIAVAILPGDCAAYRIDCQYVCC